MNISLLSHEWLVILLGIGLLLADLWLPASSARKLGLVAAAGLALILAYSLFFVSVEAPAYAFGRMYVLDSLALFFKRFFLLAALLVVLMSTDYAKIFQAAQTEFYAILLFSLSGMLFAASANDFAMLFVSLELITVSFYVLTSFHRTRVTSLEAGVKYLVVGALSTGFTVFGIALVAGISGKLNFEELARVAPALAANKLFLLGMLFVLVGLGFKIAAFPFQIWAPDVYQGAPSPATAFLAVGSKAAGFALLLRVLFVAAPAVIAQWWHLLIVVAGVTILYGNLGALPQRNIKRILGYSSIAHAGYLLLGIAALSAYGKAAVLFYLGSYLFTVLAAFAVICVVVNEADGDDISALAGLNQRAPLLAAGMALALVSLAGIPPLAGFFGKFLLLKAAIAQGPAHPAYYWLSGIAIIGVLISIYYYFGVIRVMFWSREVPDLSTITPGMPVRVTVYACIAGMLVIGIYPGPLLELANKAIQFLP